MSAQPTAITVPIRIACSVGGGLLVLLLTLAAVRPDMVHEMMHMMQQMIPLW